MTQQYIIKKYMKKGFTLMLLSLLLVLSTSGFIQEKEISGDEVLFKLAKGRNVKYEIFDGEFFYPRKDENRGCYISEFRGEEKKYSIVHTAYSGNKKDNIRFNDRSFTLNARIDPLSLVVYRLGLSDRRYLCLIGKGQSASGSGVQVSFFTILELDKSGKATNCYEFSSRFGNIRSILDYSNTGSINYFKTVNGNKMGQYVLTINDMRSGRRINDGFVILEYKLNDKFVVLKDSLR